jgi:LuxR family maltose regulon positive regulatory protein
MLEQARVTLEGMAPSAERDELLGELGAMVATIAVVENEIPRAIEEAQRALDYLPEDDLISRARANRALGVAYGVIGETGRAIALCDVAKSLALAAGNYFLAAEIMSQLAAAQTHQGRLREAARTYQDIVELGDPPARFPPAGLGYIGLAELALEWNDLEGAQECVERGIRLCQQGGIGYGLRPAYCFQAIVRQALGDTEGALEAIDLASQFEPTLVILERAVFLVSCQVRLRLLLGEVETAARWAKGEGVMPGVSFEGLPVFLHELQQVALARVYLAQGELDGVLAIVERVCDSAQAGGRMARVIELSLLKALALQALGQPEGALDGLARCLALAEAGGYVRLFLEAGESVAALLHRAAGRGLHEDYVGQLLAAFGEEKSEPVVGSEAPGDVQAKVRLVEPLSERERQVLSLICDGLSNREIAERLVVTVHTVKKHSSNIYGKLGVTSRTQAAARARELGLC